MGEQEAPEAADERERERRATWFELFCDLVFVAAIGQTTHRVGGHPTAGSVAGAVALFVPVWWTWVLYAVRANRFDPDDTGNRLLTMVGMAGVSGMAVFIARVGHGTAGDAGFVASYLVARWTVVLLYAWAGRTDGRFRGLARSLATGSLVSSALWAGGLLAPHGTARYGLWALAMASELALPFLARRRAAATPSDAEHLRERFGLFTIIVLGEVVLGFTGGLSRAHTEPVAAVTGLASFALCVSLWWTYFNASGMRAGGHAAIAEREHVRHVFVFGHLPLQCGLAVAGGALGAAVEGESRHLPLAAAACIAGGTAAFLAAGALVRAAFTGLRERVVQIRLGVAAVVVALLPATSVLPTAAMLGALAAVVAGGVVLEGPAHRARIALTES